MRKKKLALLRYKPTNGLQQIEFQYEHSLDFMLSPGCYTIEIDHTNSDMGLPLEFCGNKHYVVGTLIVTDSGTDGPLQSNRLTGQVLALTSCKQNETKVYSRTRVSGVWSEWRSLAMTGMYNNISSTDELLATVDGLVNENIRAKETDTLLDCKLIKLAGMTPNDAVNEGDIIYNSNSNSSTYKQLRKFLGIAGGVRTFEGVPFVKGAIYTYNNDLYVHNGIELVCVTRNFVESLSLLKGEVGASARYYATYDSQVAKNDAYISDVGAVIGNANFRFTAPIEVSAGEVLTAQGLGAGIPYYVWVTESGDYISTGEVCATVLERKVMAFDKEGYVVLNIRQRKASTTGAPEFEAIISGGLLLKDKVADIQNNIAPFSPKEYINSSDVTKEECYTAFHNAMNKKCADYGITDYMIGGPAGYGLESWNGVAQERGKSSVDIYGLIKILGLVYGDWRLVDMWGEYDNPALTIPITRGTSIVNQEISSTLGRSEYSYILKDNYCVLAAKGGTHEGMSVNYSAACTCDALKGNVVIGYVNTKLGTDAETASRYRALKSLMDIAVKKFEDRNSDVTSLENVLKGQMVQRAAAVIMPNTNPQLLHRLDFANSSYYKLYDYNPGMVDTMSTIKSLTTAVALDYIDNLDTVVTIVESDLTDATGGTHPIFQAGDKLSIKDLIYANSVRSSNQASYALARIIGQAIILKERL